CSAMSMKILGPSFDLHLGGEDLIFPHHEDEIAQSEGAGLQPQGERFVKYWLHGAHLMVEGKKMSKSLGNFFTLRELLARGFSGREIRHLLLTAHYRELFNFTVEGLQSARTALSRLDECLNKLREAAGNTTSAPDATLLEKISASLDDDLNVSAAWGVMFEWVREMNRLMSENRLSALQAAAALAAWQRIDSVFGVGDRSEAAAPPQTTGLLEQREAARKAKDFKRADAIRDELKAKGWLIEDTPKGPRLKKL
ncbi:MAG: cysteine--tRNA ligase, partial [Verrucomicrobia bacterium]